MLTRESLRGIGGACDRPRVARACFRLNIAANYPSRLRGKTLCTRIEDSVKRGTTAASGSFCIAGPPVVRRCFCPLSMRYLRRPPLKSSTVRLKQVTWGRCTDPNYHIDPGQSFSQRSATLCSWAIRTYRIIWLPSTIRSSIRAGSSTI